MIPDEFSTLLHFLLPGVAILLLASALCLYWPTISGRFGESRAGKADSVRLQKRHRERWRLPLAHAMTIGAVVLLVTTPPSEVRESNNRSITPEPHFSILPNHESKAASPAKPSVNRPATPIQVVAMSNNRAAIIEDGKIITLNTGQASPRGWQLSSASPRHAVLISPDGRRFTFGNAPPKGE